MKGAIMADLVEGQSVPAGELEQSGVTSEPWDKVGLTKEKYAEVFAELKSKVDVLRPEAKKAAELETELSKLREAEEVRKQKEMSDIEKAQAALDKQRTEMEQLQTKYERSLKDNVYERTVSSRLAGYSDTDRDLVRTLYNAAGEWTDAEELTGLLDDVDNKWKAHLDAIGGERRPDVGGSTRNRMMREPGAVTKDEVMLAQDIVSGGALALMKRRQKGK